MLRRELPSEAGGLVVKHHPLPPLLGWGLIAVASVPFPALALLGGVSVAVVAVLYVAVFVLLAYVLAPSALLEHRLHEHAVVFRTLLPGTPVYVIPHDTIRAESIRAEAGPERAQLTLIDVPQQRTCVRPLPSVVLTGLDVKPARLLGKGRISWDEARRQGEGQQPAEGDASLNGLTDWRADYPDAERQVQLTRETVLADQKRFPHFKG